MKKCRKNLFNSWEDRLVVFMPHMIHVTLIPESQLVYEVPSSGRIAQSLFLRALSCHSRDLALRVKGEEPKPYSVTRITTSRRNISRYLAFVSPDDYVRVTFKLLDEDLLNPLIKGITSGKFSINGIPVEVADITVVSRDYWHILSSTPIARGVTFEFRTPAIIGEEFPPPAPKILKRAFDAWNKYSGIRIPESLFKRLYWAEPSLPMLLQSDSVKLPFNGQRISLIGYRGVVSYSFRRFKAQEGAIFASLARFVEFSGVGRRTSMGFGMTRVRLWKKRPLKREKQLVSA